MEEDNVKKQCICKQCDKFKCDLVVTDKSSETSFYETFKEKLHTGVYAVHPILYN